MREITAAVIALIVLLTLARVSSHRIYPLSLQIKNERNVATVAAYVMINVNCTDVRTYLREVNATDPLPDSATGYVAVWCGEELRVYAFSWRG
ncbi:hypothetical protein IG193_04315 [Infirmifilum lucidum]|uniref:Uncharacterized protein n=1 Tax=Infirmifilum lucidum TaxID=2776706 RepID=A0A7L9FL55_9CREN|nr:hypothetical protein [Infirmifilum lucidum]QOJ79684.1 hypothetical protein IG193_04315 [Infirmifilum lucidum]